MSAATAEAPAFGRGGGVSNSVRDGAGAARPHDAITDEPRQPAGRFGCAGARNGFKARNRAPAVDDQNGIAALETIDEGTQTVLGFGYAGFFHQSYNSFIV